MKKLGIVLVSLVLASVVSCGSDGDGVDEETRGPRSIRLVMQGDGSGTVIQQLSLDLPCKTSESPCLWNFDPDPPFLTTTLTATADAGSVFAGWGGDCAGVAPCTITVDDKYDVTATFNLL